MSYPIRRPSIGDDGDVVLAADPRTGVLPDWAPTWHLVALTAHGYARKVTATAQRGRYVLTPAGVKLRAAWAEIRGHTVAESKPYGLLTEPSPGEVADNDHPDGPSLLRGRR